MKRPPSQADKERNQRIWGNLHAYIRNAGSWITSLPSIFPATMECLPDSDLPKTLAEKGYILTNLGTESRFLPQTERIKQLGRADITRDHIGPGEVSVWSIDLP